MDGKLSDTGFEYCGKTESVSRMIGNTQGVLVVDDEQPQLDFFKCALESASFAVWTADSYDDAVSVFHAHKDECDLLVVDVSLPGKNGVELAMDLLPAKPGLKVLFISGWVGGGVLGSYGVSTTGPHFLQKPLSDTAFLNRVREILDSDEPSP